MNLLCSIGSTMTYIGYILLAIFVLLFMIMIHEFGHYIAGKLLHFKINEFSIGFGKAIFSKTLKSGEKFSLRWIPLGGYCAFDGEDEDKDNPDAFNSQAPWKRLIVLFMGAFFNFLSSCLVAVAVLMIAGNGISQITSIVPTEYNSQLQVGDVIEKVGDTRPSAVFGTSYLLSQYAIDEDIPLVISRDGEKIEIVVKRTTFTTTDGVESQGVGITAQNITYNFGQALLGAVPYCLRIAWDCLVILGMLFTGQLSLSAVGGPITTISSIATVSSASLWNLLILFPLIGVNLATFNLLPFPALDGARMVFVLIEWIRGKPINRKVEGYIHGVGLMILFAFVIIVDLIHIL